MTADSDAIPLREYVERMLQERDVRFEQRFQASQQAIQDAMVAQEKAVNAALQASDRAVLKAETASERRFEGVNEFRATLADQAALLMPRAETTAMFKTVEDKIAMLANDLQTLRDYRYSTEGRRVETVEAHTQNNWLIGTVVVIALAVVQFGLHFLK